MEGGVDQAAYSSVFVDLVFASGYLLSTDHKLQASIEAGPDLLTAGGGVSGRGFTRRRSVLEGPGIEGQVEGQVATLVTQGLQIIRPVEVARGHIDRVQISLS